MPVLLLFHLLFLFFNVCLIFFTILSFWQERMVIFLLVLLQVILILWIGESFIQFMFTLKTGLNKGCFGGFYLYYRDVFCRPCFPLTWKRSGGGESFHPAIWLVAFNCRFFGSPSPDVWTVRSSCFFFCSLTDLILLPTSNTYISKLVIC